MTAYEESMAALVERVRALEVKLKIRDRVDEIHADSLKHVIDKFDERVETLESRAHGVMDRLREFDGYVERLEELEAWNREGGVLYNHGTKLSNLEDQLEEDRTTIYGQLTEIEETLNQDRLYAVNREREEHKARWHATFNTALQGLLAKDACSGCHNDEFIRAATVFADLAHGPLEQKAPIVETYNMTAAYVAEVNALVKAVLEACDYDLPDQVMALLTRAVEPFEAQK